MTVRVSAIVMAGLACIVLSACGSETEGNGADTAAADNAEREARAKAIEAKADEAVDEVEKEMSAELAALQSSDDAPPVAEAVSDGKASNNTQPSKASSTR